MDTAIEFSTRNLLTANVMLILGFTLFGGAYAGRLFQRLKIPQVVGYITIGIALGLSGLRFLGPDVAGNLQPFNSFALAIIGFMVGGELKIGTVRKYGKQFSYILLVEATMVLGIVAMDDAFALLLCAGATSVSGACSARRQAGSSPRCSHLAMI